MSRRPLSSHALAEALRSELTRLDEVTKARIERRLVEGRAAPGRAAATSTRSRRPVVLAAAVALAAAALLVALGRGEPAEAPVARFERRELASSIERGTLEAGSTLRTAAGEVAELSVGHAHIELGTGSRLQLVTLRAQHVALRLAEGTIRVAFHPAERGGERLIVDTPAARVEVVGTVFRVAARDGETVVRVTEGTVRVVPSDGAAPRLVHAGQETGVGRDRPLAETPPQATERPSRGDEPSPRGPEVPREVPPASEEAPAEPAVEPAPSRPSLEPAGRLREARAHLAEGRTGLAAGILRALTRGSTPAGVRAEAWMLLADIHRSEGQVAEERAAYERASEAGRGRSVGHNAIFSLARLQERRLGDRAAARATYARYLAEAPNGALARQAEDALCRLGEAARCRGEP